MPSDDLVLNVRQIAGYPPTGISAADQILFQRGGLGGPYQQTTAENLVSAALVGSGIPLQVGLLAPGDAEGSQIFVNGLSQIFEAGLTWNAYVGANPQQYQYLANGPAAIFQCDPVAGWRFFWGPGGSAGATVPTDVEPMSISPTGYVTVADQLLLGRDPTSPLEAATAQWVSTLRAQSVTSFNMRFGDIMLTVDDIICAGGAPSFSPIFSGTPRAETPPPWSNSSRLATTAFVQMAIQAIVDTTMFAPIDSPNFTGVPTAPTPAAGSTDGQLATTAFVMNAVADSVTGVASFNGRTGLVVLTAADVNGAGGALLLSPAFTGTPTAPTAAPATSTTQLATTAFVMAAIGALPGSVSSFNTRTGAVVLTSADIAAVGVSAFNGRLGDVFLLGNDVSAAGGALLASPAFTGTPTAPTAIPATNTTQIATTAFVTAAVAVATSGVQSFNGRAGVVVLTAADVTGVGGALLASPTFTGVPAAPTAAPATSTTQLATCAFVMAAVSAATAGVSSFNSRTGAVTLITNDISAAGGALLASPIFTGTPTAPTATPGTNTAQLATCAFVMANLPAASTAAPLMNGTAAAGSSAAWSRGDHVHPTDTSRASVASVPIKTTLTPLMNGAAAIGTDTGWAAGNHVHPTDTTRAAQASLANYLPLAGGTVTGNTTFNVGLTVGAPGVVYGAGQPGFFLQADVAGVWPTATLAISGQGTVPGLVTSFTTGAFTATRNQALDVGTGQMYAWTNSSTSVVWNISASDRRLKRAIAPAAKDALAAINALAVYEFDLTLHPDAQPQHWNWGLMADEVDPVPSAHVPAIQGGYATLRDLPLIGALIKAVQQLSARVEALEAA